MIRFLSISSGSNGNCYYFSNGSTSFLIDAGVGPRIVKKALAEHNLVLENIDFILVTHDHIDHIKALGIISEKFHKPVYTTKLLKGALLRHSITRTALKGNIKVLKILEQNDINGIKITPFIVPHDATETVGYFIEFEGKNITLVTDCGEITPEVLKFSKKADILIFETNYDTKMLKEGPYPEFLKKRIGESHHGHLSNAAAAEALKEIFLNKERALDYLFLCHLSEYNNTPELAKQTIVEALISVGAKREDMLVEPLLRGKPSKLYSF